MHVLTVRLKVIEKDISKGHHGIELFTRYEARGINSGGDTAFLELREQLAAKVRLNEAFSTRESDTAARGLEEVLVLKKYRQKLVYGYLFSVNLYGIIRASFLARSA